MTRDQNDDINLSVFRMSPVNNIVIAVRDRPLCRSVLLHKDAAGRLGIKLRQGCVEAVGVNSTAARNGLLIDHQIIEVIIRVANLLK